MSKKKKQEETGNAKPFFARYLEGQDPDTASAKVGGSRSLSYKKKGRRRSDPESSIGQ
jgi:hypothetical protein